MDVLLLEAATGRSVWAEAFERELRPFHIIALRNEVANRVARTLAQPYGAIQADRARDTEGRPPEMLGTYRAVLLFHTYWRTFDREMIEAVRLGLERAVAAEPDYAEAQACLSLVYSNAFRFRHPIGDPIPIRAPGRSPWRSAGSISPRTPAGRAMPSVWPTGLPAIPRPLSTPWRRAAR